VTPPGEVGSSVSYPETGSLRGEFPRPGATAHVSSRQQRRQRKYTRRPRLTPRRALDSSRSRGVFTRQNAQPQGSSFRRFLEVGWPRFRAGHSRVRHYDSGRGVQLLTRFPGQLSPNARGSTDDARHNDRPGVICGFPRGEQPLGNLTIAGCRGLVDSRLLLKHHLMGELRHARAERDAHEPLVILLTQSLR
jgi:hypothetical protein